MADARREGVVTHEVINTTLDIPKFSGEPNTITISQFLARIDTLIANKGVTDDQLKIETLKQHVDSVKGRARFALAYGYLNSGKLTYDQFVQEFRRQFTDKTHRGPLQAMVKHLLLRRQKSPDEGMMAYTSRLDVEGGELIKILEQAEITRLQDVVTLMHDAHVLIECPKYIQERFFKDYPKPIPMHEMNYLLNNYTDLDSEHAKYLLATSGDADSRSRPRQRSDTPQRGRSASRGRSNIRCFRCNRQGHTSRHCNVTPICENCQYAGHSETTCRYQSYCSHHKVTGHRTRDCRARAAAQDFRRTPEKETDHR